MPYEELKEHSEKYFNTQWYKVETKEGINGLLIYGLD